MSTAKRLRLWKQESLLVTLRARTVRRELHNVMARAVDAGVSLGFRCSPPTVDPSPSIHYHPANVGKKQRHLYRGNRSRSACTTRAAPAHIFGVTFGNAETLRRAAALGDPTKGDGHLFSGSWSELSRCGLRLSRGLVIRAPRLFDGRSLGEAPKG